MNLKDLQKQQKKLEKAGVLKINETDKTLSVDYNKLAKFAEVAAKNPKLKKVVEKTKRKSTSKSSSKSRSSQKGGANVTNNMFRGIAPRASCPAMEPWELDLQDNIDAYIEQGVVLDATDSIIGEMLNVIKDNPILTVGVIGGVFATLGYQKIKGPTKEMIKKAHKKFKNTCESAPRLAYGLFLRALEQGGRMVYEGKKAIARSVGARMKPENRRNRVEYMDSYVSAYGANAQQRRDVELYNSGMMRGPQRTTFPSSSSSSNSQEGGRIKKRSSKKRGSKKKTKTQKKK